MCFEHAGVIRHNGIAPSWFSNTVMRSFTFVHEVVMNRIEPAEQNRLILSVCAILLFFATTIAHAQEQTEQTNASEDDRLALKRGIDALINVMREEENTDRAIFPLIRQTKIQMRNTHLQMLRLQMDSPHLP